VDPDDDGEPGFDLFDQRPESGKSVEIPSKTNRLLPAADPRSGRPAGDGRMGKLLVNFVDDYRAGLILTRSRSMLRPKLSHRSFLLTNN
jgi:hypothetical protein